MTTGAPSPHGRERRGQGRGCGRGRGPLSPSRAEPADLATPSSDVVSQPPSILADSGVVGSAAAVASSSHSPARP
ncbi:UNVERIFIED_CONTAM: hypothetical protein Sradi_4891200 [Sesamum radiatum]|uniref:Uncharacterized protein n=1 Tax=Sesamum radiatum TaxID=300843 RepID=A0AAW2MCA1_SESRA